MRNTSSPIGRFQSPDFRAITGNIPQFHRRRCPADQRHRESHQSRRESCRILYQRKFDALNLQPYKEFIHFGLTSQDINNTAVPCSFRDAVHDVYYPVIDELIAKLEELAEEWKEVPMLAKTHGQPASPTRLGKSSKYSLTG